MPNLEALVSAVMTTVADPDLEEETVIALINEGYANVAGRVVLPKLEVTSSVQTDPTGPRVPVPTDFNFDQNIFSCASGAGKPDVTVLSSSALMVTRYPKIEADDEVGDVEHLCLSGEDLLYHPVPTVAQTLKVKHHKNVNILSRPKDTPKAIPPRFQRKLLHAYACKEIFGDIEDESEGTGTNTLKHEARYEKQIAILEHETQQGQSRPAAVRDGRGKGGWI